MLICFLIGGESGWPPGEGDLRPGECERPLGVPPRGEAARGEPGREPAIRDKLKFSAPNIDDRRIGQFFRATTDKSRKKENRARSARVARSATPKAINAGGH